MKKSLARQIGIQAALVIFGAMAVYAVVQYVTGAGRAFSLLLSHLWHTLALSALIYAVVLWRLRTLVFQPVQRIADHGYEMAGGIFKARDYPKTGNEIDSLGSMMNLVAVHFAHLQETPWKQYADSVEAQLEFLNGQEGLPDEARGILLATRNSLRKMEIAVMRFSEPATTPDIAPLKPARSQSNCRSRFHERFAKGCYFVSL